MEQKKRTARDSSKYSQICKTLKKSWKGLRSYNNQLVQRTIEKIGMEPNIGRQDIWNRSLYQK